MPNFGYKLPFNVNNVATSFLPAVFRFVSWPFEGRFGRGKMKLKWNIPRSLQMDRLCLNVWYKGQPLQCDTCGGDRKAFNC